MSPVLDATPFRPPAWLRSGHLQTLWANWAPRPGACARLAAQGHPETIGVGEDRLRVYWNEVPDPGAPTVIVLHGLTGCAASPMVLGVGSKARAHGFRVCRVDLRNSTADVPSREIGHAGRSEDLRAVIEHTIARHPDAPIAVVGFSLGGNVAFKTVGEYGAAPPPELRALVGISVPIDLDRACHAIDGRSNAHYRRYFLHRLRANIRRRAEREPALYRGIRPPGTWSIRDFDEAVVAPLCGFHDAADYYARSSALPLLPEIRVPSLLIHADDDPFIPGEVYRDPALKRAPAVDLIATRHGGHVGFWGRPGPEDDDPFWAEHRAIEFVSERTSPDPGCSGPLAGRSRQDRR